MNRKLVLLMSLTLLIGMLNVAFNVQKAKATGTIYIRADGSIDPPTAPITTLDNVTYTITGNINSSIVIERNNTVLDGAGYTVQGTGASGSEGIELTGRSNVTIKNVKITEFYYGIRLDSSSNSSVSGNNIAYNLYGVWLDSSSDNKIFHNNFVYNNLQVGSSNSGNVWDDGYPSGGNYWSDYNGTDANSDGIGDTPYIIDADNRDRYPLMSTPDEEIDFVVLVTTMGNITIELFGDMPITAGNFKNLTQFGIYDGTLFHRVISDFVIQGGDASAKGIEVPPILDELPNIHSNVRGYVAMAKTSEPNSARDQFYINLDNNSHLDSHYSVFGKVVAGLDVVDSISEVPTDESDRPLQNVTILKAQLVTRTPLRFSIGDRVQTTANLNVREGPGLNYTIIDTMPDGTSGQILGGPVGADGFVWWDVDYDIGIRGWSAENWLNICIGQPPSCHISLQKDGAEIDQVDVSDFFDICVGGSTDDIGIEQVRFSNDDVRDGKRTGRWTEWYDWSVSSGDWNAATKIRGWTFYTPGHKEVWSEVMDNTGQTDLCSEVIFAPAPALPVLTSPLVITPIKEIYNVGDTLDAEFTIKNIGDNLITLDVFTVGGRLDGMIPPEGPPDFTFRSLTLHSGESYHYQGSLTLTQKGNYHFFIAYYIENPTLKEKELLDENNWDTCIELGEGLTHTDRVRNIIVFEEGTVPEEINALREEIDRLKRRPTSYLPYLLEADSWNDAVSTLWADLTSFVTGTNLREKYDELYQTGFNYQAFRVRALIDASRFLDRGDLTNAKKYLQKSHMYDKLSWMSFGAAAQVFDGNIAAGQVLADGIRQGCEAAVRHGIAIVCPAAAVWVDGVYMGFDFAFNAALEGWDQAEKDLLIDFAFTALFTTVQFKDLEYNTLEDFVCRYSKDVPLDKFLDNRQFMGALGAELREIVKDRIAEEVVPALVDILMHYFESRRDYLQTKGNSPIELRVVDSEGHVAGLVNGRVKHEISMSLYYNKTVTILFPTDTYRIEVLGTDEGAYGLETALTLNGQTTTFNATDIPVSINTSCQYAINWNVLQEGGLGVEVYVDQDGNGLYERKFLSDSELSSDEFEKALTLPTVESCDSTGTLLDIFDLDKAVYVKGSGYLASTTYDIYLVNDTAWTEGMPIPGRVEGTATNVISGASGNISLVMIWNAPLTPGEYDVIIDVNNDGYYNTTIDALDESCIQVKAGFQVIPEYGPVAVLGLIACLAVVGLYQLPKRRRKSITRRYLRTKL